MIHPRIAAYANQTGLTLSDARRLQELFDELRPPSSALSTAIDYQPVSLGAAEGDPLDEISLPSGTFGTPERYQDLGLIGSGGMGEVRRVRDSELNRTLAMKTAHARLGRRPKSMARFLEEAQATAQLQHPNIVPVHDIGTLPDGRIWFTMREVRGRPMSDAIHELHVASRNHWGTPRSGWSLRRLMSAFLQVCHAVAYANERGVVHRDLKPENVVVGEHGEVHVVDWGLAKILGRADVDEAVETDRSRTGAHATMIGAIAGTPSYMAPEQARGDVTLIDARTDVYGLGSMLYELLSGRAPYEGADAHEVLAEVRRREPLPLGPAGAGAAMRGPVPPPELADVCRRAMSRAPEHRFQDASAMAAEIEAWLDGARRRDQAIRVVMHAVSMNTEADQMSARAAILQASGEAQLEQLPPWASENDKAAGWEHQDEATGLWRQADLKQLEIDQELHAALQISPDLPEAHSELALRYEDRHKQAEAARDPEAAARAEVRVRLHAGALAPDHPTRTQCTTYLKGDGRLSLVTDPPGATVRLLRYELRRRRLVAVDAGHLGATPLKEVPVPMGSYLCELRHPDHPSLAPVRYPVEITRQGHWDGVRPGDETPYAIWLPGPEDLSPDEVYVPAGWFRAGGDPRAVNALPPTRVWADAFVTQRFSTTNHSYLEFLNDLVASDRADDAAKWAPRERGGSAGEGAQLYHRDADGRFILGPDADGDIWLDDWPVFMIDWASASAFLGWKAARTRRPWSLPGELEWEKAARGVDGRWYPWGDFFDWSWAALRDSRPGPSKPVVIDGFPVDCSPYGVRGVAGGVQTWCADSAHRDGPIRSEDALVLPRPDQGEERDARTVHGGSWSTSARGARLAARYTIEPWNRLSNLGCRGIWRVADVD